MIPIMAVAFDFGVEITYPIGESFSTGILMSAGQFFGIILTITSSELMDKKGRDGAATSYYIMTGFCLFSVVLSMFVKEDLRRYKAEHSQMRSVVDM